MISLNDDYAELTVVGKDRSSGIAYTLLILLAIILGFAAVFFVNVYLSAKGLSMLGTCLVVFYILFGIPALWRLRSKKSVEYDYTYIENDIEIFEVFNRSKRKLKITVHLDHAKCIAPVNSQTLSGYEGEGIAKVRDFTSYNDGEEEEQYDEDGNLIPSNKVYAIITSKDGDNIKILIEADEHMEMLMKYRNKDRFYEE
ncbi:MAG: hypothetical protein K5656_06750 [Lachnospiraceae bacterium]|nr:hypothetical protein [Lachnospiraceae bacterium]